jgi:hypothetical protein
MNLYIARVNGAEKLCIRKKVHTATSRGQIYVYRTIWSQEGVAEVAVRLDRQEHYKEWVGCWSAL